MLDNKDECACQKCSTAALVKKLMFYDWFDLAPGVNKTLNTLLVIYLQSEAVDLHTHQERETIGHHIFTLVETVENLEEHDRKHPKYETT